MSRSRKRGSDMGSKKCSLTGLGREDGIVSTVILHKTRRHVHQIALEALPAMLSARCTDGGVKIKQEALIIRCGAPLGASQTCDCWIGVGKFQKLAKKDPEIAELLQQLWFRGNERAGRVAYCPRAVCNGSSGFILDSESVRTVTCPCCRERWCRDCERDHTGYACSSDRSESVPDAQRCPDCKEGAWKDSGCDHMQCGCGCYFCYVCGMKITSKYNYHVKYSPDHGTYVCPQRLTDISGDISPIKLVPEEQLYGEILLEDEETERLNEWAGDTWDTSTAKNQTEIRDTGNKLDEIVSNSYVGSRR